MKTIILTFLLGSAVTVLFASVLVHPAGPVKARSTTEPLLSGADIDPPVLTELERSCQNCHSDRTEWPWYSYIAPVSWLVESDVGRARGRMNLSHWNEYTAETKGEMLARVGAIVRSGEMPPARYTVIHANAKLSSVEREQIYEWAHAERLALKSAVPATVGTGRRSEEGDAHP